MACGIRIIDRVEGEHEFEIERGMRSRDEIERLGWQFRRSVQSVIDVEVGPALERPMTDEQIAELAADYAEGEAKEAING